MSEVPTVAEILEKFVDQVDSIPSIDPLEADRLVAEVLTKERLLSDLAIPTCWEEVEDFAYDFKDFILGDDGVVETIPFPKDNPKSPFACADYVTKKDGRTYSLRSFRRGDFTISIDPATPEDISGVRLYAKEATTCLHYRGGLTVTSDRYGPLKAFDQGFTLTIRGDDPVTELKIETPSRGKVKVREDRLILKGGRGFSASPQEAPPSEVSGRAHVYQSLRRTPSFRLSRKRSVPEDPKFSA